MIVNHKRSWGMGADAEMRNYSTRKCDNTYTITAHRPRTVQPRVNNIVNLPHLLKSSMSHINVENTHVKPTNDIIKVHDMLVSVVSPKSRCIFKRH
jgi:hypothetical protein